MKPTFYLPLLCTAILTVSCNSSDDPNPPVDSAVNSSGVYICNEGNFMYGNAALSFYDPEQKKVSNQVFYNTNSIPLGDVCVSMSVIDGKGYVVVNNSGKVQVVDPTNFKFIATIGGLTSPRYIVKAGAGKLYVSDMYSPSLTIIDPATNAIRGTIFVGRGTEAMVTAGRYTYTCSWSNGNQIYKIDNVTDTVLDSVTVTIQPNSLALDKDGYLWVLSDGGHSQSPFPSEAAALTMIKTDDLSIVQTIGFPDKSSSPSRLTINAAGDHLYFIYEDWETAAAGPLAGIYRMPVTATALPAAPLIRQGNRLFYGLGLDPANSDVYVSDAIDYVQRGTILRYTAAGEPIDEFKADIIPGSFCFYTK